MELRPRSNSMKYNTELITNVPNTNANGSWVSYFIVQPVHIMGGAINTNHKIQAGVFVSFATVRLRI